MSEILDNLARDKVYINSLRQAGVAAAQAPKDTPAATIGIFAEAIVPWAAGTTYKDAGSLFTYENKVGFTRQPNVLAQAHQPPFSTGMESVYGVRPIPDLYGVYPYTYNMAATVGMRVSDGGALYACIKDIALMLWGPASLPEYFEAVQT